MSRTARGVTSRPSSTHRNSGSPAPQHSPIHTAEKAAHGLRERSTELNPISERAALKRGVATRVGPCNALALVFVERRIRADRAQQNRCRELCCRLEQVKETTDLVLCRRIGRVAVGDRRQRERQRLNPRLKAAVGVVLTELLVDAAAPSGSSQRRVRSSFASIAMRRSRESVSSVRSWVSSGGSMTGISASVLARTCGMAAPSAMLSRASCPALDSSQPASQLRTLRGRG